MQLLNWSSSLGGCGEVLSGVTFFTIIYHCAYIQRPAKPSASAAYERSTQCAYQRSTMLTGVVCLYKYQLGATKSMRRNAIINAATFFALTAWSAYLLYGAVESKAWWQALFSFGLGSFLAQVGFAFLRPTVSSEEAEGSSQFQRRLSQFFVLLAAVGLVGILINRYS
jgi:hypothetical protein